MQTKSIWNLWKIILINQKEVIEFRTNKMVDFLKEKIIGILKAASDMVEVLMQSR